LIFNDSDDIVKKIKGKNRPITPLNERFEIINSIRYFDYCIVCPEITAEIEISIILPDYYVKGGDHKNRMHKMKGSELILSEKN